MTPSASLAHLPVSRQECKALGWDYVDIVLVTGDAYIDHPSFGVALIGRLLESHGYRVAILPQPHYDQTDDFRQFGRPRLFFGITAGNLDSIVANYSGNGKVRSSDAYSPNGNPWFGSEQTKVNRRRPDRASLLYANLARAAFKDVPVILGGIEASLRRFIHYDYKQERLRGSVLTDAKADLLVYGMGEKSIIETARRISENMPVDLIDGTCRRLTDREMTLQFPDMSCPDNGQKIRLLPSWADIEKDKNLFMEAERTIDLQARGCSREILAQRQQSSWIVQYPASPPLTTAELDALYQLPFSRKPHPTTPDIPAYTMIRHSITIVRGCSGNCSFCAISRHQGPYREPERFRQNYPGRRLHIRQFRRCSRCEHHSGAETRRRFSVRCRHLYRLRRLRCILFQCCGHAFHRCEGFASRPVSAGKGRSGKTGSEHGCPHG